MVFPDPPTSTTAPSLELHGLAPDPIDEWRRMLKFVNLNPDDLDYMAISSETLMQRAHELVVDIYDYLSSVPETAAILGWETKIDAHHLAERRRFFAIWLNRSLGLDQSDELANILFRAGKIHAAHGPRKIHVPSAYITASIGLVTASFARYMQEAKLSGDVVAGAMAGWNKYFSVQLHMMLFGYQIALDYSDGTYPIQISLYGRIRPLVGKKILQIHCRQGQTVANVLNKFFSYYPQTRPEALETIWESEDKQDSLWREVNPVYIPKGGWRVLLNGRELKYTGGFTVPVKENDEIAIFPPGR